MMRAALAEMAENEIASAYNVARRVHHDQVCDCGKPRECNVDDWYSPPRSQLVSARRALHELAAAGTAKLEMRTPRWGRPVLTAVSVANGADSRDRQHIDPCFHCGRSGLAGSGWTDGLFVCTECMRNKTNVFALVGGAE
jgi:hypothetical protein